MTTPLFRWGCRRWVRERDSSAAELRRLRPSRAVRAAELATCYRPDLDRTSRTRPPPWVPSSPLAPPVALTNRADLSPRVGSIPSSGPSSSRGQQLGACIPARRQLDLWRELHRCIVRGPSGRRVAHVGLVALGHENWARMQLPLDTARHRQRARIWLSFAKFGVSVHVGWRAYQRGWRTGCGSAASVSPSCPSTWGGRRQ
jgi:hypothetical protein